VADRVFVRVGPSGLAYGPWPSKHDARAWLVRAGFRLEQEGASFRLYEAHDPELFAAHQAMRPSGG
jgi:hypothetical protein